eukprot:1160310-Pelagomonas_calceolata.AAC.2
MVWILASRTRIIFAELKTIVETTEICATQVWWVARTGVAGKLHSASVVGDSHWGGGVLAQRGCGGLAACCNDLLVLLVAGRSHEMAAKVAVNVRAAEVQGV